MWYVVDEFGFATTCGFSTKEEAEKSQIMWEKENGSFGIEYQIEYKGE